MLHLIAAFAPFLIFFSVPDAAALPLIFLVRVVAPVMAGSLAVAVISVLLLPPSAEPSPGVRAAARLARGAGMDLWAMSLVATMLAIVAVLFFGAYGFLVLHFFYGPPIAMQVLMSERLSLRESLRSARAYLRGSWRLVLYLFSIALILGMLTFVVLGAAFSAWQDSSEPWSSLALAGSQGIVTGAFAAVVAAAQVALYLQVRMEEPAPAGSEERAGP